MVASWPSRPHGGLQEVGRRHGRVLIRVWTDRARVFVSPSKGQAVAIGAVAHSRDRHLYVCQYFFKRKARVLR